MRVAFFSHAGGRGNTDLWIADAASRSVIRLASLKGYADRPRWSPDGTSIALLYVEGASGGGPLVAAGPQIGVIDTAFHNQRIGIVSIATGQLRPGSPPSTTSIGRRTQNASPPPLHPALGTTTGGSLNSTF